MQFFFICIYTALSCYTFPGKLGTFFRTMSVRFFFVHLQSQSEMTRGHDRAESIRNRGKQTDHSLFEPLLTLGWFSICIVHSAADYFRRYWKKKGGERGRSSRGRAHREFKPLRWWRWSKIVQLLLFVKISYIFFCIACWKKINRSKYGNYPLQNRCGSFKYLPNDHLSLDFIPQYKLAITTNSNYWFKLRFETNSEPYLLITYQHKHRIFCIHTTIYRVN